MPVELSPATIRHGSCQPLHQGAPSAASSDNLTSRSSLMRINFVPRIEIIGSISGWWLASQPKVRHRYHRMRHGRLHTDSDVHKLQPRFIVVVIVIIIITTNIFIQLSSWVQMVLAWANANLGQEIHLPRLLGCRYTLCKSLGRHAEQGCGQNLHKGTRGSKVGPQGELLIISGLRLEQTPGLRSRCLACQPVAGCVRGPKGRVSGRPPILGRHL